MNLEGGATQQIGFLLERWAVVNPGCNAICPVGVVALPPGSAAGCFAWPQQRESMAHANISKSDMEVLVFIDTVYDNVVNFRIGFWDSG